MATTDQTAMAREAVRVLSSCRHCCVQYDAGSGMWLVLHLDCADEMPSGDTEPAAILAALRAMVVQDD